MQRILPVNAWTFPEGKPEAENKLLTVEQAIELGLIIDPNSEQIGDVDLGDVPEDDPDHERNQSYIEDESLDRGLEQLIEDKFAPDPNEGTHPSLNVFDVGEESFSKDNAPPPEFIAKWLEGVIRESQTMLGHYGYTSGGEWVSNGKGFAEQVIKHLLYVVKSTTEKDIVFKTMNLNKAHRIAQGGAKENYGNVSPYETDLPKCEAQLLEAGQKLEDYEAFVAHAQEVFAEVYKGRVSNDPKGAETVAYYPDNPKIAELLAMGAKANQKKKRTRAPAANEPSFDELKDVDGRS